MALSGADAGLGARATSGAERPILFACALIGLALALLFVAERLGAGGAALGIAAVCLPLVAVCVLAFVGRTVDRGRFLRAGGATVAEGGAGALTSGLALAAEWIGAGVVPFVLLAPSPALAPTPALALGGAFGLFAFVVALAGAVRRAGSLTAADLVGRRLASRTLRWTTALASIVALIGLMAFQLVLMRTLLLALVGEAAAAVLAAMVALAAGVIVLGGQRSLTLVNAFLGFFLALAFVVPAFAALAGLDGLTGPLPLDRAFALVVPGGPDVVLFAGAALAMAVSPVFVSRAGAVRRGALFGAGAWALLAAYVVMAAALVAYTPNDATASIVETLPTLGWLGAVWAGFAAALFAAATHVGHDLRRAPGHPDHPRREAADHLRRSDRREAVDHVRRGTGVAMALTRLAAVIGAVLAWASLGWLDGAAAHAGLVLFGAALSGLVAPVLVAAVWWRRVSRTGAFAAQAAGAAVLVAGLWPGSPLAPDAAAAGWVAPAAFACAAAALAAVGYLMPRAARPDPALMRVVRRPAR